MAPQMLIWANPHYWGGKNIAVIAPSNMKGASRFAANLGEPTL
jgi:hypothetical protein